MLPPKDKEELDQVEQADLARKAAPGSTAPLAHNPKKKGKKKKGGHRSKARKADDSEVEGEVVKENGNMEGMMNLGVE